MGKLLYFIAGGISGIYVAQNYKIPELQKLFSEMFVKVSEVEKETRKKPEK